MFSTRYVLGSGLIVGALLSLSACAAAPVPTDTELIAVTESFYTAMKAGDTQAAMRAVAPDAVFLESGGLETRAEYEAKHLPADIEFEKAVTGKRGPWQVAFAGNDAAWMHAVTEYQGTFQNAPVNFVSAQLVVLARADSWQIRAIHWSSRKR